MISFPVAPAAPGLAGAPPAAAALPSVAQSAKDGAFDFVDLLKQLTANVAAPVDVMAPADAPDLPATAASITAAPAGPAPLDARAPVREKKEEQKESDPTAVAAVIAAPILIALPAVAAPKNTTPAPSTPACTAPDVPPASSAGPVTPDLKVGPAPGMSGNHGPIVPIQGHEKSQAPVNADQVAAASADTADQDSPAPVVFHDPVAGPTFRSGVQESATQTISAPAVSQPAPQDAAGAKRDSSSNSGTDRRALDAIAPRAAAPAPQTNAPVFQVVTADVRPVLVNTAAPPALSSTTTPALTAKDTAEIPQQIVQAMRMQWNNGIGDAKITLKPEYLGDVTISIRVDRDDVAATLQASAPEVRQWIESHESTLRQMLSERGLRLDELAVTDVPEERQASDEENRRREAQNQPQPARRRAAANATFEVIA